MFLEYKVSKKQGFGKAHVQGPTSNKRGKTTPALNVKFHGFHSMPRKDYVVQHAPCDVGIIKVDSNDPVTRPAGGKQYDTSV